MENKMVHRIYYRGEVIATFLYKEDAEFFSRTMSEKIYSFDSSEETLFCGLTEKQIQEKLDEHHRLCIKNNPWFNSSKKPTSITVEDDGIHFWNHIKMKDDGTFVEAPKHEEEKTD